MSDTYAKLNTPTNKGQQMTNSELTNLELQKILAENILHRYTPLAFSCACKGTDWNCENALNDPYLNGVMDTLRRVTEYILEFNPNH